MKIAIPVSGHDKHLIPAQAECLLKMGGLEEFPVIYFPTPSAKEVAYEAAERLGAQTHVLEQDFEGGAPVACNNHFAAIVYALAAMGNTEPFLWMEADMLPTAPRWPSKLQDEYRMRGQPFLGNVVDTPFESNGKLITMHGDTMMMGCGIYPASMERDERIKPLILDLAKSGMRNPRIPFDVYLRWAIKNIGVANTELIADMWATENYRMEAQGLVCDSVDHGDKVVRKRHGYVSPKAVLVHGCKDGSLAEIVLGNTFVDRLNRAADKMLAEGTWEKGADRDANECATAAAELTQDVEEDFWGGEASPAPLPTPEPIAPVVAPKPVAKAPEPAKPQITRELMEKTMNGKKWKATDLATKLKVGVADLVGTFARNGYMVAKGGFVQSTIPITKD